MAQNSTRRGLAWAAAASLIASLFGAMPASADANISLTPAKGTSTGMFIDQVFSLKAATLNATTDASVGKLKYQIEKSATAGALLWTASSIAGDSMTPGNGASVSAAATMSVVVPVSATAVGTAKNIFSMKLNDVTTSSASVDVKVTAFIDNDNDGVLDDSEPREAVTVNFLKYSSVTANVALTQPIVGDTKIKATGSISGINTDQLSTGYLSIKTVLSSSATASSVSGTATGGSVSPALTDHLSNGAATITSSTFVVGVSVSAQAVFNSQLLGTAAVAAVKDRSITAWTISPVKGDNAKASGSAEVEARVNSAFKVTVKALTNSTAVASVPGTLTLTTSETLSSTKYITVNGSNLTTSAGVTNYELALTTGAAGTVDVEVSTTGFGDNDTFSFVVTGQNLSTSSMMVTRTPVFTVKNLDGDSKLAGMGATTALNWSVVDQWSVLSKRTNQRLSFVVTNPTGMAAKLDAVAVSAGKVTANLVATPSTVAGTIEVYAKLQEQNQDTGIFSDMSFTATTVSVIVSSSAPAFSTKPAASYSSSISYGTVWSYSPLVAAGAIKTSLGGASVTITGTDVIFWYDDATYSGTVTIPTNASGNLEAFKLASRKAGTKVLTFKVGTTETTASYVVDEAIFDTGTNIAVSTQYIDADAATQVTVTLTDANGNPVQTYGATSGSVAIDYVSNKGGAILGSIDGKTNAKGQFSFTILTGGNDNGSGTLTVTYNKNGTATATKDVITKAFTMTVGKAPVAAAEGKLTVGSFKGFLAIYASGYEGKKLSYKVAGKWGSVASLKSFQRVVRKTGAGFTVKVDLYVDGSLVKSETVTTK